MAGIKIKRNDTVEVIAGKDKGKRGRVLRVMADRNRLLVEHVMMIKKHVKPNPQRNIKGGIAEQESLDLHVLECDAGGLPRATEDPRRQPKLDGDKTSSLLQAVSGNVIPEKTEEDELLAAGAALSSQLPRSQVP